VTRFSEIAQFICLNFLVITLIASNVNMISGSSPEMFKSLRAVIIDKAIISVRQSLCDIYTDSIGIYTYGYGTLDLMNLEISESDIPSLQRVERGISNLKQESLPLEEENLNVCNKILDQQVTNKIMVTDNMSSIAEKISYRLSITDAYIKDRPIVINFTLENSSDENLWVLNWYTPLEGLKGKIFDITCDGKEIPYEGIMMKRGQPTKEDYVQIAPGRSVSAFVDLLEGYKVPAANQCKVDFKGRIYDVATAGESIPKKVDDHRMVRIVGNAITFRVSP
jgi:hypothetical protein